MESSCTDTNNGQTFNSLRLYNEAKAMLGKCLVAPGVPHEVGCASSVNTLYKLTFGIEIGGGASTYLLLQALIKSPYFTEVQNPLPGDIQIDATGTSTIANTTIEGHVGVRGFYGILSNDSDNGLWSEKYTDAEWKQRYEIKGGYRTRYFRVR